MAKPGEAEFKSNVLLRDEKGFAGIPFKRLVLAGVGACLMYSMGKLTLSNWAIPLAVVGGILLLVMTSPRGGIPRWQRLMYHFRGGLIIAMADKPDSLAASLGKLLELRTECVVLDGGKIFSPAEDTVAGDMDWSEWVTFSEVRHAKAHDGLVIVEGPKPHLPVGSGSALAGGSSQ
jgi:hypothetical protein